MSSRTACILLVVLLAAPAGAATLQGRVTRSDTGAGVSGAIILIRGTQYHTVSTADGSYVVNGMPAGRFGTLGLTCSAPGLRSVHTGGVWIESGTVRDFELNPPTANRSRIYGTATCAGTPCAGVLVKAIQGNNVRGRSVSAANGAYSIVGLGHNTDDITYAVEAIAYGYLPGSASSVTIPGLGDGGVPREELRDIDLTAGNEGGYVVSGVVGLSDNPLDRSGSRVYVNGQAPELTTTTDTGGAYALEGVPAGELSFTANHTGYLGHTQVDVRVSGNRSLNFVLNKDDNGQTDPRYTLAGRVTLVVEVPDGGTAPSLAGSHVSIWSEDGTFQRSDQTDGDGNYEIRGIDPDLGNYSAGASREGFIEQVAGPWSMQSDRNQDFTLEADPDYDWGPGPDETLSSCGCGRLPRHGFAGLSLLTLLLMLRRRP